MKRRFLVAAAGGVGLALASLTASTNSEWSYKYFAIPLMSFLDPEISHRAAVWLASKGLVPKDTRPDPPSLVGSERVKN